MLQAPFVDSLLLNLLSCLQDCCGSSVIDVCRGQVAQALVVPVVVVVVDEGADLPLEVAGQEVVFEQNAVLQVWCQRSILPCVCG